MVDLNDLFLLTLVMSVGSYVWSAQGVREQALRATRRYCQQQGLQLLDDSVALRALWWKRDSRGHLRFWRAYQFEFAATGDERYVGRTVTLGREVESIWSPAHRVPETEDKLH